MVGGALDREVEGDLQAVPARRLHQALEVLQRAELGRDRRVAALGPADRPGAAGVAGLGGGRVVAALAVGAADRVDRRQVDDVEAQLGEPGQLQLHPGEAAERPREELVPRADAGEVAIHVHLERLRADAIAALRVARQGVGHLGREGGVGAGGEAVAPREGTEGLLRRAAVGALQPAGGVVEQRRTLGDLALEVLLAGGQLALQLVAPRRERIDPRLHLEAVEPQRAGGELAAPAVDAQLRHRRLGEPAGAGRPVPHHAAQCLVAVAHEVALHDDDVAEGALGRPAAALDRRPDVVDLDARRGRAGWRGGHGRH